MAVTAEIVKQDLDENGNIRVWTCHKIDGVEVESKYPKIDGKYVYATRYSKQNFKDCADSKAVEDYILNDIKQHSYVLVKKSFDSVAGKKLQDIRKEYNATANLAFAADALAGLVGKSVSITEAVEKIDTDNDGVVDLELTIKPDGTVTSKATEVA